MEINSPPSNEVLDFCNSFKKSFKEHGWPNSKIETWKMTPLQKFIKDSSSLKHNSKYLLSNNKNNVIAVIGDGAMSAGMAYEAMNNAGVLKSNLIVVLNDNDMSIARPVGAMSNYLAKLLSGKLYFSLRETIKMVM